MRCCVRQFDVKCFSKHVFAWAWTHVDVRGGVRLIQSSTIVKSSVWRVALLIYSAATTVRWAQFFCLP
jgi:hypothetical protein